MLSTYHASTHPQIDSGNGILVGESVSELL